MRAKKPSEQRLGKVPARGGAAGWQQRAGRPREKADTCRTRKREGERAAW